MPSYQATIIGSEPTIPSGVFQFVAACDLQAIARMPAIDGDFTLEIWREDRLVAIIDAHSVMVAQCDLAAVATGLIDAISSGG
jgi:hypothetical protein